MYYVIQQSDKHVADLQSDIERMVGKYNFVSGKQLYSLNIFDDEVIISHPKIPRKMLVDNLTQCKMMMSNGLCSIPLTQLQMYLERFGTVFLMSTAMNSDVLAGLSCYSMDDQGEFFDCSTEEIIDGDQVNCISFASFFKLNKIDAAVCICNASMVIADSAVDDIKTTLFNIEWLDGKLVSDHVFYDDGLEVRLWSHDMMSLSPSKDLIEITSSLPYQCDGTTIKFDVSSVNKGELDWVRIEYKLHELWEQFTHQSERFWYEFNLYKK